MVYKPKRIAPPSILARHFAAMYERIEQSEKITDAERELWFNAVTKAFTQHMDGVRFDRHEDGTFTFPSRSRTGVAHHVNGTCDCEACAEQKAPCWHRPAKWAVISVEQQAKEEFIDPQPIIDPQPLHCPACAAPMFPAITPGGEDCFECSNPRCKKTIHAEAVEAFLV